MKDDNALMGCIGWLAYTLIVIIGGSIVGGWALSVMWGWFIVPLFNLPTLGIAQAVGLMCVVGMVWYFRGQTRIRMAKIKIQLMLL